MVKKVEGVGAELKVRRSVIANFLPNDESTSVNPNPRISFRLSVPCSPGAGRAKALGFKLLPPPACGFEIQNGCPGTRSGRGFAPPMFAVSTVPLNGKP